MTALAQRLFAVFLLSLAVAGGVTYSQQRDMAALTAAVARDADAVARAYRAIAERAVLPSENALELTQEQRKTVRHVRAAYSALSERQSLPDTVRAIGVLQAALFAYLRQSLQSETLRESPSTLALARELGGDGAILALLTAYNTSADAWNTAHTTPAGTVRAQFLSEDERRLPSLRIDGESYQ